VRLQWWGVWCCVIPALPVILCLDHRGRLDLALPLLGSIAAIVLLVVLKWRLRIHIWFWTLIVIFSTSQLWIVWRVPWPRKWVYPLISAGIVSIDFCVLLFIVTVVENLMTLESHADGLR
jgi:hypothetical protein